MTVRGVLGAVDVAAGATEAGRPACEAALESLTDESPYLTPRGTEVLWCHLQAELEIGADDRARELIQRTETWLEETASVPGYASALIDALRTDVVEGEYA